MITNASINDINWIFINNNGIYFLTIPTSNKILLFYAIILLFAWIAINDEAERLTRQRHMPPVERTPQVKHLSRLFLRNSMHTTITIHTHPHMYERGIWYRAEIRWLMIVRTILYFAFVCLKSTWNGRLVCVYMGKSTVHFHIFAWTWPQTAFIN